MGNNDYSNELIREKSPYLLQHAHNPVNWLPWGEKAFSKANLEDKPVFLSIGYSTCHWCHVMAHESFEDREIAAILNQYFVPVKVDREERPDIDNVYMAACQAATGSGGWPLTLILAPDARPFFAATYLPKTGHWGKPSLTKVLDAVRKQWSGKRKDLLAYAEKLTAAMRAAQSRQPAAGELTPVVLQRGFAQLTQAYDKTYGGFGRAPKFPTPHNLMFLLSYYRRTKETAALAMVEKTLDGMRAGGIYDHLGFGFSRYSVDEKWIVPHFEKMLYDNALLAYVYLTAAEESGKKQYAKVAEEILTYVLNNLTGPRGEFYSAEDADSDEGEGSFYTWTQAELTEALGVDKAGIFAGYYNVTAKGNFERGTNILHTVGVLPEEYAARHKLSAAELGDVLEECRRKLAIRRGKRRRPFRDDKVLLSWNCLMVAALAKASRVLDRVIYRVAAEKCLEFLLKQMKRHDGRLLSSYRDGETRSVGYLDDYSYLLWALLELQTTASTAENLAKARELADEMIRLFWDGADCAFYLTGADSEPLLIRPREWVDAALPSGSSVAVRMLIRLSKMTGQENYREIARNMLNLMAGELMRSPMAYTYLLTAVNEFFPTDD